MVGYTLGGGMSFLGRKYGLTANNVRSIELVTADGRLVRTDRDTEPDLFWALRGGGGSFGIVTAIELQLFPITQAYAGILWYPIDRGPEVLHAWRNLTQSDLPDELTTVGRFLNLPPIPEIPDQIRGQSFAIVEVYHLGDPAQADELLAPLRALGPINDTIGPVPMPAVSHMHMDPEQPVPVAGDGVWSIDCRRRRWTRSSRSPGQARSSHCCPWSCATSAASSSGHGPGTRRSPRSTRSTPCSPPGWCRLLNFAETPREAATFWTEQAYHRLRRIKAAVDPENVIRANHPIPPAPLKGTT